MSKNYYGDNSDSISKKIAIGLTSVFAIGAVVIAGIGEAENNYSIQTISDSLNSEKSSFSSILKNRTGISNLNLKSMNISKYSQSEDLISFYCSLIRYNNNGQKEEFFGNATFRANSDLVNKLYSKYMSLNNVKGLSVKSTNNYTYKEIKSETERGKYTTNLTKKTVNNAVEEIQNFYDLLEQVTNQYFVSWNEIGSVNQFEKTFISNYGDSRYRTKSTFDDYDLKLLKVTNVEYDETNKTNYFYVKVMKKTYKNVLSYKFGIKGDKMEPEKVYSDFIEGKATLFLSEASSEDNKNINIWDIFS